MRSESQESDGTKESRKFAEYLKIESLGKTLGFLLLPRRIKDGTMLCCYKKHVYVSSSRRTGKYTRVECKI